MERDSTLLTKYLTASYSLHPTVWESIGIKTLNLTLNEQNKRGRRLAWSRLRDLGSRDPGSNPGDPTKPETCFCASFLEGRLF